MYVRELLVARLAGHKAPPTGNSVQATARSEHQCLGELGIVAETLDEL
jgi:hypothetical protein